VRNAIAESLDGKGASPPLAFDLSFSGNPAFLWDKLFVHDFLAIAITTLALSMGGPFWFDLLSSLVKVRQAGKKPGSGTKTADADAS
jgi:hypothetical protein